VTTATLTPPPLAALTPAEREELYELLVLQDRRVRENALDLYRPYGKQLAFHAAGATYRERLFMAGNQLGKTLAGGAEVAMHLTGRYPQWWSGRRFPGANRWIAGSESAELTRKGMQRILFGPPEQEGEWGTGMIPKNCLLDISRRPGVPDAIASAIVRHEPTGDVSTIQLQSYDQGRTKWQSDTVEGVWFDEEPDLDLYSEGITRTNVAQGPVILTFTPLLGMSAVVKRYLVDKQVGATVINMTIEDALHYTKEQRDAVIAAYPEHEREARAKGVPMMGSGRVFPIIESAIKVEAFAIPTHWPRIVGIDFGVDHPSAMVWMAWDRDTDTLYVYDAWRESGRTPAEQALVYRPRGSWIPVAWPHDGLQRRVSGNALVQISKQYAQVGVNMLPERATFEDGTHGLEAGVGEMLMRMQSRRLRVFSHLNDWFEEFRMYHRKDGIIVPLMDDLLSATRYAMMMRRHAKTQIEAQGNPFATFVGSGQHEMLDPTVGY
jgi:phage terminase large subunit-like protein